MSKRVKLGQYAEPVTRAGARSWLPLSASGMAGYQGRRDFRGRGNLRVIVETLLVRCVAPAQEWRSHLWPAVVCLFYTSSSSQLCSRCSPGPRRLALSVRSLQTIHPILIQVRTPETGLAPSLLGSWGRTSPVVRQMAGIGLIFLTGEVIRKMICAGTGTGAGGPCPRDNRQRSCVFALIGGRWLCGRRALRHTPSQHPHPSGAWMGHPPTGYPPEHGRTRSLRLAQVLSGYRWGRLRSPLMLPEMGCRITTGSRGGLLPC